MDSKAAQRATRFFVRAEVSRDILRAVERAAKTQDVSVSKWLTRIIKRELLSPSKDGE